MKIQFHYNISPRIKSLLTISLTVLCGVFLTASLYSGIGLLIKGYGSDAIRQGISAAVIRFHVVANSDTDEDQNVKLLVRKEVSEYLEPILKDIYTREEAYIIINNELESIQMIADKVLTDNHFDYHSKVSTGIVEFPTKKYGDITLPAGNYDALRIELGDAKGENWWCIMFPQLCFLDITKGIIPEESKHKLKVLLTDEEYAAITEDAKDQDTEIEIRFFFFDKLRELFGL